ncbi:MAG: hypothetical protein DDT23_00471 [candidate division WS2 bacterium]|nr:hypothetical protein [Candidatus Lithacetigena glycinireducens]
MKKYMVVLVVAALVLGISVTAYGYGMIRNSQGGKLGLRIGGGYETMLQRKASILGITVEELKKELESGKTFLEIATHLQQQKAQNRSENRIKPS